MTKRRIKIITLCTIALLVLFAIFASSSHAGDSPIDDALDGFAGILFFPVKFIPLIFGALINAILVLFKVKSMEDILFNRIDATSINFFDTSATATGIAQLKTGIATWYTGLRNIAIIGLAIICIYVGIRMALATIAEDKARYRQMFQSWIEGVALVIIMHYVIILTIAANNAVVAIFDPKSTSGDMSKQFITASLGSISFVKGVGNAVAYLVVNAVTIVFLISYIARMVRIAFLIIIAPLVCLTYSIDKMGDNKSQALNTWFKEFFFNVIIQPFHCLIYRALTMMSLALLNKGTTVGGEHEPDLGSALIAIVLIVFIFQGEKIIKHIFKLQPQSASDTVADAALAMAVLKQGEEGGSKAVTFVNNKVENYGIRHDAEYISQDAEVQAKRQAMMDQIAARKEELASMEEDSLERQAVEEEYAEELAASQAELQKTVREAADRNKKKKRRINKVRSGAEFVTGVSARVGFGLAGVGLAAGLGGSQSNMVIQGKNYWDKGVAISDAVRGKLRDNRLEDAYEDYQYVNQGKTEDEIRQDALDLMHGVKIAQTDEEKELRDAMLLMRNSYIYDGVKEGDLDKTLNARLRRMDVKKEGTRDNREDKLSDAITRYKNKNSGKTMEEIRHDAVELMSGRKTAQTAEERALRDSMIGLRNSMTAQGMEGDKLNKELITTMTKLESRLVSSGKVKPNVRTSHDTSKPKAPTNPTATGDGAKK